jgi:hypothetical protein
MRRAKRIARRRNDRDVADLPEKAATLVEFGRQLFRERRVEAALFARAVENLGRQGVVEFTAIMGY